MVVRLLNASPPGTNGPKPVSGALVNSCAMHCSRRSKHSVRTRSAWGTDYGKRGIISAPVGKTLYKQEDYFIYYTGYFSADYAGADKSCQPVGIWCLILPLAMSSFNVIICKTFFRTTVPDSIIESAKIDGASQMKIFWRIVVPISKPVFATIALFLTFGYWNDWFQSALYISDSKLVSLQALLNNMMKNLEYIANNPSAGLSLQQYRNSMPSESVRMAIAIIIVIPIACAYPFFQKYFISGLTVGAVKG